MCASGDVVSSTSLRWRTSSILDISVLGGDRSGMVWLLVFIIWWVTSKVQPDEAHPSPGWTRGRWDHRGTLLSIWPLSSNYEDNRPVMPCWHQLFHTQLVRFVEDGDVLFLPVQVKRTCSLFHDDSMKEFKSLTNNLDVQNRLSFFPPSF